MKLDVFDNVTMSLYNLEGVAAMLDVLAESKDVDKHTQNALISLSNNITANAHLIRKKLAEDVEFDG